MNNYIRKISIGSDYKNAMHYVVEQDVMGGSWKIHAVSQDEEWKFFSINTPITIEYNVNF